MMRLRPAGAARRRVCLPRRTARLRLTALYGGLFLACGAVLLAVAYLLVEVTGNPAGSSNQLPAQLANPPAARSSSAGQHLQLAAPFSAGQLHQVQAAQKAADTRVVNAVLRELLIRSPIALAIVTVIALGLGWFVAGRILRPLSTITAAARRITASNLNERLYMPGPDDELKALGDTLDDLFTRLEASFQAQRHFVANASHELRTPITRERAILQVALDDPATTAETWRATTRDVLASNTEQENLIDALLTLATSESGLDHRERIDMAAVCDGVLRRLDPDIQRLGLHVETAIRSARLDGDPRLIERLVANLIDNAVGHNVAGGHVQVTTAITGSKAVLSVSNTGPVIRPSELGRLFRPFQRLDPHRTHHNDGHGLGLAIVRAIADAHGAGVSAHPMPRGGLSIQVTFPRPANPPGFAGGPPGSDPSGEESGGNGSQPSETAAVVQERLSGRAR
jgi:signal transduction histidine kinase